jgi:hypothetical protein
MAYRKSVVSFLDVLGFRRIVEDEEAPAIANILDLLTQTAAEPVGPDGEDTETLSFSDSIVRVRPVKPSSVFDALLHEVQNIAAAQWSLFEAGILIRGGVTVGDVATSPGRVFGRGFVRAYDLESSLAGGPRVVIDPAVVKEIRDHLRSVATTSTRRDQIEELREHLRLGDDGLWFVDYLASMHKIIADQEYILSAIKRQRSLIIEKANGSGDQSKELPKYLWLVRYHNKSVKRLFPKLKSLKITRTDVPASDELLRPRLTRKTR